MPLIHYTACPVCNSAHISKVLSVKDFTVSHKIFDIFECADCTHRFTQDIPDEQEIGAYYKADSYISHTDTKEGFINSLYHMVRKRTLQGKKNMVEKGTGLKKANLLDIGAGTGAFLNVMKQAGWKVTGLEPDVITRQRAASLYQLDLQSNEVLFDLQENTIDAITMWHVLEHVQNLHSYMQQIKKILKPSGKIFIAVPNYTSIDATIYRECWAAYDVPRHLHHFSPTSMRNLFQLNGLQLTETQPMWFDSFYISMLSEQYKTGNSALISAGWNGLRSNANTLQKKEAASSLIYIASK